MTQRNYRQLSLQPRPPALQAWEFRKSANRLRLDALTLDQIGDRSEASRLRRDAAICDRNAEAIDDTLRAQAISKFGELR
ncbi:MAG: hypothetical protein AAF360_02700 [Pseudomonadota bacterium]